MYRLVEQLLVSITVLGVCVSAAAAPPHASRDIGREVLDVFVAKCAACHGPDLAKPQGRFGYVLDLKRIRENPEMLIPGEPHQSELWELVNRGEMPPADSPRGPLTREQKEIVREWLAAGAPDPVAVSVFDPKPPGPLGTIPLSDLPPERSALPTRTIRWLGRFHLLLLHFPIALAFAAGLAEAWNMFRRHRLPSTPVRFCVVLAALSAIPTVGLGWLHAAAGEGARSPELLDTHRWLGTMAAACLVIAALVQERDVRRHRRTWWALVLLATAVLLTGLAAHFGGLLAHGEEFFSY